MSNFTDPAVQAMNLIRYIGDEVSESGKPIPQLGDSAIAVNIDAPSNELAAQLFEELCEYGIIKTSEPIATLDGVFFRNVSLTLKGWERYNLEKRGRFDGNYGFLAMQFNDPDLEAFVREVLKPAVEGIGFDLHDMRDSATAGIIDNIMRVKIRDAKFVIADLTHDNNGAYWEAGYAEGLGKPVIYICKKKKFEAKGTHFDTNHCTTVPWSRNDDEGFRAELTATLRRSLDQSQQVDDASPFWP